MVLSRKQSITTRAMPTRKPRRCRQTNCAACSLFLAAVLAVFAVCSAALAVLPAVWPARLAAAYCFFDGVLLLPSGQRIAGKLGIIPQAFVVKGGDVGLFQLFLGFGGLPVRFQLVGNGRRSQSCARPSRQLLPSCGALSTPTLSSSDSRISLCTLERTAFPRRIPYCMGQLGRRLFLIHFLKAQAGDGLAGGRGPLPFPRSGFSF